MPPPCARQAQRSADRSPDRCRLRCRSAARATRASRPSVRRISSCPSAASSAASPLAPVSPATMAGSPGAGDASVRIASSANRSSTATYALAPASTISQASGDTSPQARPAITVSRSPVTAIGSAGHAALEVAVGLGRLDDHELRAARFPGEPEGCTNRRRQRADAGLHEHVRRRFVRQRPDDLARHHAVAVHHVDRNLAVTLVGRVRHHGPAILPRLVRGVAHRVVVVARHADHFGPILRDRGAPPLAHGLMHVDDAAAAEEPRAPGDGASVIAVGRAGHGDRLHDVARRCPRSAVAS